MVRTTTPTVSGEAEPGAQIDIIIDGEVVDTVEADEDGNWSWTPEDELEEGEITVTAQSDSPAADRPVPRPPVRVRASSFWSPSSALWRFAGDTLPTTEHQS